MTEQEKSIGTLEKSLEELEALVERLESGDLPLEQALAEFERGIKLTRECQAALKDAEQKVEILLKKTEDAAPVPFEPPANGE
ncbi:MAG TPA: exodeoxyribonuclease VII small subunit [Gammaproteobacteria bacterium]|nr:exodeoxyribonuclease VII small subunit [Gammaproteobacteria bacterium]